MGSSIVKFGELKTAGDVARALACLVICELDDSPATTSFTDAGGEMEFGLDDGGTVRVLVEEGTQEMYRTSKPPAGKVADWLTVAEREKLWLVRGVPLEVLKEIAEEPALPMPEEEKPKAPARPGVLDAYRKPRNLCELARLFEVAVLDATGISSGGGYGEEGGSLEFSLADQDVKVFFFADQDEIVWRMREDASRLAKGESIEWLLPDEAEALEAYRKQKRQGRAPMAEVAAKRNRRKPSAKAVVAAAFSAEDSHIGD
jgi:hypothetical protein